MIRNVTVYCGSSNIPDPFRAAAMDLGKAIATRGWGLVYGGNQIGLMGVLADAARAAGGRVIGVTPQMFGRNIDRKCDELIIATDMRQRKQILEDRGDALVALPGGLGTFEEIFDALVGRHLDTHGKPIILIDIAGYYRPLVELIERGIALKFIKPGAHALYRLAPTVEAAIEILDHWPTVEPGPFSPVEFSPD